MATAFDIELPGALIDGLVEDDVPATAGKTPVLINRDPEPNEHYVPKDTDIALDIATVDTSGAIDTSATKVFVNDMLVFDGGIFSPSFGGARSAYGTPQSDVLRIVLDQVDEFTSQAVVTVRVVTKAVGELDVLDETYQFFIADTTVPHVVAAEAIDLMRVEVTFNEDVIQSTDANGALLPANWQLDRLGDYLTPVVSARVVGVEPGVVGSKVYLLTDIPLTPGGAYRATAANVVDTAGNAIEAPDNIAFFFGWTPPVPLGRSIRLYDKLPQINRDEDITKDLLRWCGCLQEITTLLLYDIDRFIDILDPDTAPEEHVDAMLADLGNPFDFALSLVDKRRLANLLVRMYQLKGTAPGIIDVARFFLGLEITLDTFNGGAGWTLGESSLGETTKLATSDSALLYSFEVIVGQVLGDTQREQLTTIIEYMKPGHTHFVRYREPALDEGELDHLVLGESMLGENWSLH